MQGYGGSAEQSGELITLEDAGKGPAGKVARWVMELDLSSSVEKSWRKRAKDVINRYRDEKSNDMNDPGRYSNSCRYNILYSNVQTICPALFNQSPKPDVRRRYRDNDPVGKVIADMLERALSYSMDDYDFDRYMRMAIKDQQLTGRGVTRVRYEPRFTEEEDEDGEKYDELKYEEVRWEHVNWADFRHGPGRIWDEVEWVAFCHLMTRDELREKFGEIGDDVELDYAPVGMEDKEGDTVADTFKRATIWEIWSKPDKEVVFISKSLKERPLKTEDDPLELKEFFPVPRPLYPTSNTDSLTPIEPFRYYQDQADELDNLTKRISGIIQACKVRGIYDSTITEMSNLLDVSENILMPATDVLPIMQAGGLERAVWIWPIEKIAGVLVYLYNQQTTVKTTIFEITGIADIMRGSSSASETLGAQQLKAQFGTMRLNDMQRDVQRYARDLVRMAAEIMAEKFQPDTLLLMTDVKLPTPEEKMQAQMMVQQGQAQGQPVPPQIQEILEKPTIEECLQVLRDDNQRCYRIDIETDSTIAGDQAADQKAVTELLQGVASFIQNAGPAVEAGYLPLEAAKSMLMMAIRRFKMGREVEDALDMIGEDDEQGQSDPAQAQQQQQAQQLAQQQAQMAQQEAQAAAQEAQVKIQMDQAKMQMDQAEAQSDAQIKQAEIELKNRELALKEFEAQKPEPDRTVDLLMARERMQFEAAEADKQRQVELAKAVMAQRAPSGDVADAASAMSEAAEIMSRITSSMGSPDVVITEQVSTVVPPEVM